jgi:hypothetical protein
MNVALAVYAASAFTRVSAYVPSQRMFRLSVCSAFQHRTAPWLEAYE